MSGADVIILPRAFTPRQVQGPETLADLASRFLEHKAQRGASTNTITSYQFVLEQFVGWLGHQQVQYVVMVRTLHVDGFINYRLSVGRASRRTAAHNLAVVKSFLGWCQRQRRIDTNPAAEAEPVRFVPTRVLSPEVAQLVQVVLAIPTHSWLGVRDRAFFYLMLHTATRVSALTQLDVWAPGRTANTVTPEGVVAYTVKGGRQESKQINTTARQYLDEWLALRGGMSKTGEPALFISRNGGRVTRQTMLVRIKKYGAEAGLHVTNHTLRHARARDVVEKLGIRVAADLLDHTTVTTTANIYGLESKRQNLARIEQACPLQGESKAC